MVVEFRQSESGMDGALNLHRDGYTGEWQIRFNISPLKFRTDGLGATDVSPAISQYVQELRGEMEATGKILFNDAWATPVQVAVTGSNLIVSMRPNQTALTDKHLELDFGRTQIEISLPPLSLEKGWARLNIVDGGVRISDTRLENLTGTISLLSLSPLTCPQTSEPATSPSTQKTQNAEQNFAATVVACLSGSFAKGEPDSSKIGFDDAMAISAWPATGEFNELIRGNSSEDDGPF